MSLGGGQPTSGGGERQRHSDHEEEENSCADHEDNLPEEVAASGPLPTVPALTDGATLAHHRLVQNETEYAAEVKKQEVQNKDGDGSNDDQAEILRKLVGIDGRHAGRMLRSGCGCWSTETAA